MFGVFPYGFLSFLFFVFLIFDCVCVVSTCMCIPPGTRVTDSYEMLCGYQESIPAPLQMQQMLSTSEPIL